MQHCQTVRLVRGSIHLDSFWRYTLHSEVCYGLQAVCAPFYNQRVHQMLTPAYPTRRILFDMNEAIHNQDTVPPGNISAFNDQNEAMHNQDTVSPGDMSVFHDRIDAFIKEFKVSREP